jgi:hypothetical protein
VVVYCIDTSALVDCNSETGSLPAGRKIVTVTDSLGLESFTISRARYQYHCYRPLVAAWYERYKPNRFPKLWEQFDGLIDAQRLFSSSIVLDECSRRSPELHEWLKVRSHMFLVPDVEVSNPRRL